MNTLFPLITEYNEEFKEYYTYRQIYFKWNINSEAYHLHKQYTDFPDPSYYWVYPKGEEPKKKHVLFGTYYIQHEIWKHQFPATCEDKKFLIVPLWPTGCGLGCLVHALGHMMALALKTDRILYVKPFLQTFWGDPDFCDADNQSILCYLAPMTNCTVTDNDAKKAYNNNTSFISLTHVHASHIKYVLHYVKVKYVYFQQCYQVSQLPHFINNLLKNSVLTDNEKWAYWRIQGATFITRLNERTVNWIREYEKESCKDCKNEYDISLYIRHGDKGKEMKLIDADVYKEAIKIITSLGMKKNYTIYVNADDQESVNIINSFFYDITSLNNTRNNSGMIFLRNQIHISLVSFTDLHNQIRADHCIGTIGSNWNRLIYELKSTVGMKSDGYILEVGHQPCLSISHCRLTNKDITFY